MRGKSAGEWKSRNVQLASSVVTKSKEKAAERHKRVRGNSRNVGRKGKKRNGEGQQGKGVKESMGGVVAVWEAAKEKRKEQRGK